MAIALTKLERIRRFYNRISSLGLLSILSIVCFLILLIANFSFFPDWLSSSSNIFILIGFLFSGLFSVIGTIGAFVWPITQEQKRRKRSEKSLTRETNRSLRTCRPSLNGIPRSLVRPETQTVLEQLSLRQNVLLSGEAGSGKSGIGHALFEHSSFKSVFKIYLDSRSFARAENIADLRDIFDLDEPVIEAIERIGSQNGVIVILDQIDNIVGTTGIEPIIRFVLNCIELDGVQVVCISRRKEANEQGALRPLLEAEFVEVNCATLDTAVVIKVLEEVGITNPAEQIQNLCKNMLNLELVCIVARSLTPDELANITDEIDLWRKYKEVVSERESFMQPFSANQFIAEAVRLAHIGLSTIDRSVRLNFPLTDIQQRLMSSRMLIPIEGRNYQFQHEKLQDYLYSWDAAERGLMSVDIYNEIDSIHARNVLAWIAEIYRRGNSPRYEGFLAQILNE